MYTGISHSILTQICTSVIKGIVRLNQEIYWTGHLDSFMITMIWKVLLYIN